MRLPLPNPRKVARKPVQHRHRTARGLGPGHSVLDVGLNMRRKVLVRACAMAELTEGSRQRRSRRRLAHGSIGRLDVPQRSTLG